MMDQIVSFVTLRKHAEKAIVILSETTLSYRLAVVI